MRFEDPARPAAGERAPVDPETRLERAREAAWRALGRRDRTVAELRGMLEGKRHAPDDVELVIGELAEGGYLDDAEYARRFTDDRRRLDGWGSERIGRRLRELGVEPGHIAAALGDVDGEEELSAAVALLERRFPVVPETRRDRDRALGMLVRKGYDLELATDALRRHAGVRELD